MHIMCREWFFTESEKDAIYSEGYRRQEVNEARGCVGRNNAPDKGVAATRLHIIGAAGEMAVAGFLDMKDKVYGEMYARRGSCDLPPDIDVKTRPRHYYDLICQLDEDPSKTLVLVTIENKKVLLHGWAKAYEAMQARWKREYVKDRPCYFLPKENLRPIQSLKQYVTDALLF